MTSMLFDPILSRLQFNQDGLVPAIAQQFDTKEILMMAWMNKEAIIETLTTQRVCYFSRSRQKLWRKGESSGQIQTLIEFKFDCDGDTLLLLVNQQGVACHTGRRSCFFNTVQNGKVIETEDIIIHPDQLYPCQSS